MVFIDLQFWIVLAGACGVAALSVWMIRRATRLRGRFVRWIAVLLGMGIAGVSSLFGLLMVAGTGCESHSAPMYSPSRRVAARIETVDEGALGGATSVDLYWAYGFRSKAVYSGEWRSVEPGDVIWKSDSELVIHYGGRGFSTGPYLCSSTKSIAVKCELGR